MNHFIFTPAAERDMDELIEYIDSLPPEPGVQLGEDLQQSLNFISEYPQLGRIDTELFRIGKRTIRRRVCRDYLIFYTVDGRRVKIIGVLHGKRDVHKIVAARIVQ